MKENFAKVYSYYKEYILRPDESGFDYECSYLRAHRKNRLYATKMNRNSLPEYFCDVMRYGNKYYDIIDSRNILNLKYNWCKMNHFMKDSYLEVYLKDSEEDFIRVYSYEIFKYLAYAKKYSGYDVSAVRDEFIKHCEWLLKNEPSVVPDTEDFGIWFDDKIIEYENIFFF